MPRLHEQTYERREQRDRVRRDMLASPEFRKWTDGSCKRAHPTHLISLGQTNETERQIRFRCKRTGILHGLIMHQTDYEPKSVRVTLVVTHPDGTISAPEMYKVLLLNRFIIISDQAMSIGGLRIYQKLVRDPEVALSLQSGRRLDTRDFLKNFGGKGTPEGDDRFVTRLSPLAILRRVHETGIG